MLFSIIIPVYNEEDYIDKLLISLSYLNAEEYEVIVVDGGSTDSTCKKVEKFPVLLIDSVKGRAHQMNAGAAVAKGDVFWFIHADSQPQYGAAEEIKYAITKGYVGGALTHVINSRGFIYKFIALTGNFRALVSGTYYGDQAIFIRKDTFFAINGFDDLKIFEDVFLSKKMRKIGKTIFLREKVWVSPRRWHGQGVMQVFWINLILNSGLILRIPNKKLSKLYKDIR